MNEIAKGNYARGVSQFFAAYRSAPTAAHEPFLSSARNLIGGWSPVLGMPLLHDDRVNAVAISADGKRAISGSSDNTARLAISADGKRAISGSWDRTVRLWNVETGAAIGQPLKHDGPVAAVAISADGKRAISGSWDKTARLWKLPLPALDDPERLRLSIEVRTTFYFDKTNALRRLTQQQWLQRKKQLKALGGPCDIVR